MFLSFTAIRVSLPGLVKHSPVVAVLFSSVAFIFCSRCESKHIQLENRKRPGRFEEGVFVGK